jgi:hypothetical protein
VDGAPAVGRNHSVAYRDEGAIRMAGILPTS